MRLQDNQVYINAAVADVLGATPSDELELYVGPHPKDFIIRAISGLGEEPRILVNLHQAQHIFIKSVADRLSNRCDFASSLGCQNTYTRSNSICINNDGIPADLTLGMIKYLRK